MVFSTSNFCRRMQPRRISKTTPTRKHLAPFAPHVLVYGHAPVRDLLCCARRGELRYYDTSEQGEGIHKARGRCRPRPQAPCCRRHHPHCIYSRWLDSWQCQVFQCYRICLQGHGYDILCRSMQTRHHCNGNVFLFIITPFHRTRSSYTCQN